MLLRLMVRSGRVVKVEVEALPPFEVFFSAIYSLKCWTFFAFSSDARAIQIESKI